MTTAQRTRLQIGPHTLTTPVVLAPMAGITTRAFRRLCREQAHSVAGPDALPGLFVSEMVTSRALVERNSESLQMVGHDGDEAVRSVQLYAVAPDVLASAVRMLVDEDLADHVDLNMGCPVPKVTRRGGGAALPWKTSHFARMVAGAVGAAGDVPVTVKMRKGLDDDHLTYLDAARVAEDLGVAAITLHARTAADLYSGRADHSAVARLKEQVTTIPVLGNGDLWSAEDAVRLVEQTGCDGVVVGRGCLGRPWLFADLVAAFDGLGTRAAPTLGEVLAMMTRHLDLLVEHHLRDTRAGDPGGPAAAEDRACREIRKHVAWYLKGYTVSRDVRVALATATSREQFARDAAAVDGSQPHPGELAAGPRGGSGAPQRLHLPDGWLASREISDEHGRTLRLEEVCGSGG